MSRQPQRTIAKEAVFRGKGLHTGCEVTMTVRPGEPDTGIVFVRSDLEGEPRIPVRPENALGAQRVQRRTALGVGGAEVHTVEHFLACAAGLGLDNLEVWLDGPEVPEPEDGSARAFAQGLREAGIVPQDATRRPFEIVQPTAWVDGPVSLVGIPAPELRISYTLQYDHPMLGTQHLSLEITPESFLEEIAPARTFALYEEVDQLRSMGLIRGGSLKNAIVVKRDEILCEEPLRFPDEFVRHKILDLLGDLFLLGRPLRGHILAVRSGHAANLAFVRRLWETHEGPGAVQTYRSRTHFDITAITRIMPHRYPFLLVDRILYLVERQRVVGIKNVTINEPFFQGHFPGHPVMPAVLIIEAMAQVGGVLLLSTVDDPEGKLVYFMGIDNAKFRKPVVPGDQIVFDLQMVRLKSRICKMTGKAYVDGQVVAEADLLSTIVDR
jgi:UDP-3-O-[3-hydroxymyristoyl] N-acetylglucosamine deacetylase/3-hydroxyacyl-[acyl-carrier-protein] dehydratase